MKKNNYTHLKRNKYFLKCHLIFACKYRKRLLVSDIDTFIKTKSFAIANTYDFHIDIVETDLDHIHYLISYPPHISITSIVRVLKQQTTFSAWQQYAAFLRKHFWKENTFWSDGFFVCSIGEASPQTIYNYIASQG